MFAQRVIKNTAPCCAAIIPGINGCSLFRAFLLGALLVPLSTDGILSVLLMNSFVTNQLISKTIGFLSSP